MNLELLYTSIINALEKEKITETESLLIKFTKQLIQKLENKKIAFKKAANYFSAFYSRSSYKKLSNFFQLLIIEGLFLNEKNHQKSLAFLKETLQNIEKGITRRKKIKQTQIIIRKVEEKLKKKLKRKPEWEEIMDYMRKHYPDRVSHKSFDLTDLAKLRIKKNDSVIRSIPSD